MPRLVISGLSGGGGKTLLSLGLTRLFTQQGWQVKPCKKGPDYIDAAWLAFAARCPATNLDPYFLEDTPLLALFQQVFGTAQLAVIEGNRGLFDGRDVQGSCSTSALARTLKAPVILTLNCTKMTRTVAAVLAGLAAFEPVCIAGVVLNRVGTARQGTLIRQCVEQYTTIPVLGELPRLPRNPLPERHMGLTGAHQCSPETEVSLDYLAQLIQNHTDAPALLHVALNAEPLPVVAVSGDLPVADIAEGLRKADIQELAETSPIPAIPVAEDAASPLKPQKTLAECRAPVALVRHRPRIGYVRDEALWFYYEENLTALRQAGADLIRLSLVDAAPWPALDGLYLGGGFPELLAASLTISPHLAAIRVLSEQHLPIYAECGGLMLLCASLLRDNLSYPMAGLFSARTVFASHPQGLGYVQATATAPNPFHPVGAVWRGHEFHYSRCEALPGSNPLQAVLTLDPGTGFAPCSASNAVSACDGLLVRRTFAAYTHLFAPAVPHWAPLFVAAAKDL